MPFDFTSLPQRALSTIFGLLDDKSIGFMREVSKSMKDLLDGSYLVTIHKDMSCDLAIAWEDSRPNEAKHTFFYREPNHFGIWRICLAAALKKLNFHRKCLDADESDGEIVIYVASVEVGRLLEHLKLLFVNTKFNMICCHNMHPSMLHFYSGFCEGKTASGILIRDVEEPITDFGPYLDFIENLGAKYVPCLFDHFSKDWIKFLQELARKVNEIRITLEKNSHSRQIISIAQSILEKNCEYLTITESISMADAENLLKVFHRMGKKLHFSAKTDADLMDVQIGSFRVIVVDDVREGREINISHVEIMGL